MTEEDLGGRVGVSVRRESGEEGAELEVKDSEARSLG